MEPKIIASESTHWYKRDGTPCYEVENKSKPGTFRATTLKDAKKLDLVPSVTSVLAILARPGLSAWKEQQILLSAATSPHDRNVLDAIEWASKVLEDAQEQSLKAMEKGTAIHASIEKYIRGETITEYKKFAIPVVKMLEDRGLMETMKVEHSFAHSLGFGGKVDFHTQQCIIDFKTKSYTKKEIEEKRRFAWDEHLYQLSAYRLGLSLSKASAENWFISTDVPGLIVTHEWSDSELNKGEIVFMRVLDLWRLLKY